MRRGMHRRWVVLLVLAAGCAQDLPSTVPLGRGPLAERELPQSRRPVRRPLASSTSREPRPSSGHHEHAAKAEVDGGLELRMGDAGTPDGNVGRDAASQPAPLLPGRYRGTDVTIYHLPGFPDRKEFDPNAKTDVEQKGGNVVAITLIDSSNGSAICTLDADLKVDLGTLRPGQQCFGGEGLTPSLSSGTARFANRQLTLDLRFDLDQELGEEQIHGEIEYHFEGTRR